MSQADQNQLHIFAGYLLRLLRSGCVQTMGGVLTGGGEAFVTCGLNFQPLERLVAEISVEK